MKIVRRGVQLLVVLLLVNGCTASDDTLQGTEIERSPSPDGQLDAVLVGGGGDATTGVIHEVFIVPHGAALPRRRSERVAVFEWAYRNSSTTGLTLRWHSRDTLALEYLRAQHQRVFRPSVPGPNGPVTVILANGVADTATAVRRIQPPRR